MARRCLIHPHSACRPPICRAEVAWNPEAPLEVLEVLREDEDEHVRWRVRTNARWLASHPGDGEPSKDDPSLPVRLRLSDAERAVLRAGLLEWGGPARCTKELAVAVGFLGVEDLFVQGDRIRDAIAVGPVSGIGLRDRAEPLSFSALRVG